MFSFGMCGFPFGDSILPPRAKDMCIRSSGYSKLRIGVNVRVNGCPAMDWRPVQGVPRLVPKSDGIGSGFPAIRNG